MATYGKRILSGSQNGRSIIVVATSTLGTTIHTAVSGTDDLDEIYLYAYNISSVGRKLTIEFGDAVTSNNIEKTIPNEVGPFLLVPGWLLQDDLVVTAFADTAGTVMIQGYVNRITA